MFCTAMPARYFGFKVSTMNALRASNPESSSLDSLPAEHRSSQRPGAYGTRGDDYNTLWYNFAPKNVPSRYTGLLNRCAPGLFRAGFATMVLDALRPSIWTR